MSRPVSNQFTEATFRLSKISPQTWGEFMQAFSAYVTLQCEDAVRAQVADALVAHGRAQAYIALREDFRNIEDSYSKLNGPRTNPRAP